MSPEESALIARALKLSLKDAKDWLTPFAAYNELAAKNGGYRFQ